MIKKINYYIDIERDVDGYIYVLEFLYYNYCFDVILQDFFIYVKKINFKFYESYLNLNRGMF